MKKILLVILTICIPAIAMADDAEKIKWEKKPIAITLPVGKERMVIFPSDVRVQVPAQIAHTLRTISNDGVVYWKADSEFEAERVKVQLIDSGKIVMIDLAASEKRTKVSDIQILVSSGKPTIDRAPIANPNAPSLDYVQLTRFAAQSMYAPERLIKTPVSVTRVQLDVEPIDTLLRGQIINALPLISWQSDGLYVTAVKLVNLTASKIVLDPRDIRGRWEAASFQHVTLGAKGTLEDTTTLYLISKRPYEESK